MKNRFNVRAVLLLALIGTTLGGCIVAPYPYGRFAYGPGYYRPYYYR
jgi:hypothetical protein